MTVKSDLEKAIAQAKAAQGSYATFASATDDPVSKQMFQQMEKDMKRHVDQLSGRLDYVNVNNSLNQQQQQAQAKKESPKLQ